MAKRESKNLGGRPPASEPYQRISVCLYNRQILFLDRVSLILQERTGRHIPRAELIRAIVERASKTLKTDKPSRSFLRAFNSLFPGVNKGEAGK